MDPSLTISISRLSLPGSPDPLILSGTEDGSLYGVVSYSDPASIARLTYAPPNPFVHGQELTGFARELSMLTFTYFADVTTETAQQAAKDEMIAALSQLSYDVITTTSDAPPQTWAAQPGSHQPGSSGGRTYADLARPRALWQVSIPVQPIPA